MQRKQNAISKEWTEEWTSVAVICVVAVKASNTATHMRMGKELSSAVVRRRSSLVNAGKIKMASQQIN
jgi:hypothetical protein